MKRVVLAACGLVMFFGPQLPLRAQPTPLPDPDAPAVDKAAPSAEAATPKPGADDDKKAPHKPVKSPPKKADAAAQSDDTSPTPKPKKPAPAVKQKPKAAAPTRQVGTPKKPARRSSSPQNQAPGRAVSAPKAASSSTAKKGPKPGQGEEKLPLAPDVIDANAKARQALNLFLADYAKLLTAKDQTSMALLCESHRAHDVLADRSALALWQKLCRAEVKRLGGESSEARRDFAALLRERPLKDALFADAQRKWEMRARFALAEMAAADFNNFRPCLAELGDSHHAASESALWAKLRGVAGDAYRDIVQIDRGDAGVLALLNIIGLSDRFYRRVTGPNTALRSVVRPPPLPRFALNQTPVLHAVLASKQSEMRASIVLAYARLLRQARAQGGAPELILKIEKARDAFQKYQPTLPTQVLPNCPRPRKGDDAGLKSIVAIDGGYTLTSLKGETQTLTNDQALLKMRQLIAPLQKGLWAPQACVELVRLGDQESVPVLLQALAQQEDVELRTAAVYALGELGDETVIEPLVSTFRQLSAAKPRPLFADPAQMMFGLRERIIDAISAIAARHPRSVQSLIDDGYLPVEEAAYVLWRADSKSLYGAYVTMREHSNPRVSAYGIMALVQLQGETARWMLADRAQDDELLRCVRAHLRAAM